jgi:hypothetical protein
LARPLPSRLPSIPCFGVVFGLSAFQLSSLYARLIELRIIYLTKSIVESTPRGGHCASPSSRTTMATHRQKIVSSGRLPNAQHSEFTLLERQQRSLGKVQRYLDAPVEEDILVNDNTKAHRQWLMRFRFSIFALKADLNVGARSPVDAAHPWTPLARELCFRDR